MVSRCIGKPPTPGSKVSVATTSQVCIPPPDSVGLGGVPIELYWSTATVTSAFGAGAIEAVVYTLPLAGLVPKVSMVLENAPLTVTLAVPTRPSLVAAIVTVPAATPLTKPVSVTVAIAPSLVAHVTTRPVNSLPFASFSVGVSSSVAPTNTVPVAGDTVTVATGAGVTVTSDVPLCPSLVA